MPMQQTMNADSFKAYQYDIIIGAALAGVTPQR